MQFSLRWVLFSLTVTLGGLGVSATLANLLDITAGVSILILIAALSVVTTLVATVVVARPRLTVNVLIAIAIAATTTVIYLLQVPWAFFSMQGGFADSFAMLAATHAGAVVLGAVAGILLGRRLQSTRPIRAKSFWFLVAMLNSTGLVSLIFLLFFTTMAMSPLVFGLLVMFVVPIFAGLITQCAAPSRQALAIGLGSSALMAMAIKEYNAMGLALATCFMFLLSVAGSRMASSWRGLTNDENEPAIPEVRVAR